MSTLNTPVEARISFLSSNLTGLGVEISLTDRMSGTRFAEVELTPAQFTELLAARNVVAMADLVGRNAYAHQVGRKYVTEVVKDIPEEFRKYHPKWNKEGLTDAMLAYGQERADEGGWDGYRWSHHNYGWDLRVYRYEETTLEERQKALEDWR